MADTYWDHPSRRETKRLIDLGDAGAILDELQQGSTEWDDAREALGNLVRAAELRAAASEDTWRRWAEARASDAKAEVERLRAELAQVTTATTYLQGPEECLERECEEYFDDDGNERPGVEYCSHLKAKRLTVDEHLAAEAERDRLAGQVQGIEQAVHAFFADADQRGVHLDGMTVTELCDAVMAEIRALDGTEADR